MQDQSQSTAFKADIAKDISIENMDQASPAKLDFGKSNKKKADNDREDLDDIPTESENGADLVDLDTQKGSSQLLK